MYTPNYFDIAGPGLVLAAAGGSLMLFKRGAAREIWLAALASNCASYLLVMLPAYLFFGLLK
jgi:hypothetical protein